MAELENTPYQEKVVKKSIEPLSDFLGGVSRSKGVKQKFDPYTRDREKKAHSLTDALSNLQEARGDEAKPLRNNDVDNNVDGLYLAPSQRYFMGASTEPPMVIVTKVTDDKVHYYLFPYRKEQVLKKEIAADLFRTGNKTWLRDPKSRKDPELRDSIKAVLNGNPGEKVSLDDYQFSSVQVKYVGPSDGDLEPWKELEANYDVRVDSVLTNKQIYNLRLNNRELDQFSQDVRKSKHKNFKITKIIREEREYMIEAAKNPKLKVERRKTHPGEQDTWGELMNQNRALNYGADDFVAGEPVVWDDKKWFVVDFVPSGEEMTGVLLAIDYDEVASFVPLKDLKKHTPEEMGPDDDDIPEAEKINPEDVVRDPNEKKKEKPTNWDGGQAEGLPVDKEPKEKKLDLPKSDEKGETQEQKVVKQEETTPLPVGRVKQLLNVIDNDPVLGAEDGRFKTIVENLLRKRREGVYDSDLAAKAFEALTEMGARKGSKNPDAEFPRSIRQKAAIALRDRFEAELEMGNIKEGENSRENLITEHIEKLIKETDEQVNEAVEKEAVPFTEKEIEEFKKFENADVSAENVVTFDWNSGGKNYKVEVTKKPRASTNDLVYSAVSTFNNNQLDRERTQDSDPFKTQEDVTILNDFLSQLQLNEAMGEAEECPDTTGEADKKDLTEKDVHPEELIMGIKVEMEHTKDPKLAKQIALDHLAELPDYYRRLAKMEKAGEKAKKEGGVEEERTGEGGKVGAPTVVAKKVTTNINEIEEEGSKEKYKKETEKKKTKKKAKKEPSHTETKWVNALPIRDGRKVRTEVVGDVRVVYKTFEEKRKKSLEEKRKKKEKKGE